MTEQNELVAPEPTVFDIGRRLSQESSHRYPAKPDSAISHAAAMEALAISSRWLAEADPDNPKTRTATQREALTELRKMACRLTLGEMLGAFAMLASELSFATEKLAELDGIEHAEYVRQMVELGADAFGDPT